MNPINILKQELKDSSRSMAIFLPLSIGIGLILLGSILLMLWKLAKDDSDEPENSSQEVSQNESQETIAYPSSSRYGEPPTYDQVFSISERTGPPSYQIAVALDTPPSYGYVNEAFDPPKYTA